MVDVIGNILGKKKVQKDRYSKNKVVVVDVTKRLANILPGSDSNNEIDIRKAGVWDLLDVISGKSNKFNKDAAMAEAHRRGL